MNDSMTRLIKPLITCICAHYRQTNQICSKLFFFNQSKHILIFIQELCIYKTITFYDSSLVIKKICTFFFFLPSCSLLGRAPPVENHCIRQSQFHHTLCVCYVFIRAETRIQKNHRGKLCSSKNRFVHLLGMH